MNRRVASCAALLLIALGSRCANRTFASDAECVLSRGADWLLSAQAVDGGWHSATYGQMKNGVGNTALVLAALSRMPSEWRARERTKIDRGVAFLLTNLDDAGYVSAPRHSADYPTYATAILLGVLDREGGEQWGDERRRMREYLLAVQRTGPVDDPFVGGWSQAGGDLRDAADEVNVNISVTRFVLESLRSELPAKPAARAAALAFLARCQSEEDGGFHFTPVAEDLLNKAGVTPSGVARSYGTATADGLLALLACGVPASDDRVRRSLDWLETHDALDGVPDPLEFYYHAALSRVIELVPNSKLTVRRTAMERRLQKLQRADGSWANPNKLMREDDPLIATALAVSALGTLETSAAR